MPASDSSSQPQPAGRALDLALLLALATLWGASYTFIKVAVAEIPPITLIAGRTLIAGLLLFAIMKASGLALPSDLRTWRSFLVQALLNSVIPFTLIAWGQQTVDASLATILNSTSPIFTFLLAVALASERVTARKLAGVALGIAGVALVIGADALRGLGGHLLAQAAILAATLCYAGAAIFGRNFATLHPLVPAAGSLLCAAAVLMPASLAIDTPWTLTPSARALAALLALSVFSTALAFVLYFRLLRTLGSVGTTAQAYLRVPIGVLIGVVFLGESLSATALLGMLCVVAGVAAMTMPARTRTT
jgi:drug/metabolite transporter (DMT)-like permease